MWNVYGLFDSIRFEFYLIYSSVYFMLFFTWSIVIYIYNLQQNKKNHTVLIIKGSDSILKLFQMIRSDAL